MPLENEEILKKKNQNRLKDVYISTLSLGFNLQEPPSSINFLNLITYILLAASFIDIYGHICFFIRYKHSILKMADSICTMLQTVASIFKLAYFLFVQQKFYKTFKTISSHELVDKIGFLSQETPYNMMLRKKAQRIMDSCWKNTNWQISFYKYAIFSIIGYYFFNAQIVNSYNWYIGNTNHTNILSYPVVFPPWEHKMNKLPNYLVLTFIVGCADFISGIGALSFDGMFIVIAMHCVALIRILRLMIDFTTSSEVPKNLRLDYLQQCVDHYERTFKFYRDFNYLYRHISLVQFLLSLVIHGVLMYQASCGLENDIVMILRTIMFFSASGYELVIYCLNGQFLLSESEALPNTWYECEWYNQTNEFKQLIKMMILRANRCFPMEASWFSTLSLETLISLLQTSGSYYLLLKNVDM